MPDLSTPVHTAIDPATALLFNSNTYLLRNSSNSLYPNHQNATLLNPVDLEIDGGIDGINGLSAMRTSHSDFSLLDQKSTAISHDRSLRTALTQAQTELQQFANQPQAITTLQQVFGTGFDRSIAHSILTQLSIANFQSLPVFQVLPSQQINGANGAFDSLNNIIYLAEEFLQANAHQLEKITLVILEEIGHAIDSQINATDTPGDEGEMFAGIILDTLFATEAERILAEDDQAIVHINGQTLQIEQNQSHLPLFTSGVFTVGTTGQVSFDFLLDGGGYRGELAVFSLAGMAAFVPGSAAFIREAARRSLSQSTLGQVVIRDAIEGAKFSAKLPWERDLNQGNYLGMKSIELAPHSQFAVMLVPNGTVQTVFNNPQVRGDQRPLFSLTPAQPHAAFPAGQFTDVTGDGHTFALEDLPISGKSDRDYNDIVFQVKGAYAQADHLNQWVDPKRDWRKLPIGQQVLTAVDRAKLPLLGIIDTGFAANHPDIDSNTLVLGRDYVENDTNPLLQPGQGDQHGTHLLGLIAAKRNNGIGVDGMSDRARIWLSRAVGAGKWAEALTEYVNTLKASGRSQGVVNLSFDLTEVDATGRVRTRYELTPPERVAIEYARQNGVLLVVAAGNDGGVMSALGQAAKEFDNILTVGAAFGRDRASYSSYGLGLGLLAPGGTARIPVVSTVGTGLGTMFGTSVATAQVTGAVSQIWRTNPSLNYRQVIEILQQTAIDVHQRGWDPHTGAGLLHTQAAIERAKTTVAQRHAPIAWVAPTTWSGAGRVTAQERPVDGSPTQSGSADASPSHLGSSTSNGVRIDRQADGYWVTQPNGASIWYEYGTGQPVPCRAPVAPNRMPRPLSPQPPARELEGDDVEIYEEFNGGATKLWFSRSTETDGHTHSRRYSSRKEEVNQVGADPNNPLYYFKSRGESVANRQTRQDLPGENQVWQDQEDRSTYWSEGVTDFSKNTDHWIDASSGQSQTIATSRGDSYGKTGSLTTLRHNRSRQNYNRMNHTEYFRVFSNPWNWRWDTIGEETWVETGSGFSYHHTHNDDYHVASNKTGKKLDRTLEWWTTDTDRTTIENPGEPWSESKYDAIDRRRISISETCLGQEFDRTYTINLHSKWNDAEAGYAGAPIENWKAMGERNWSLTYQESVVNRVWYRSWVINSLDRQWEQEGQSSTRGSTKSLTWALRSAVPIAEIIAPTDPAASIGNWSIDWTQAITLDGDRPLITTGNSTGKLPPTRELPDSPCLECETQVGQSTAIAGLLGTGSQSTWSEVLTSPALWGVLYLGLYGLAVEDLTGGRSIDTGDPTGVHDPNNINKRPNTLDPNDLYSESFPSPSNDLDLQDLLERFPDIPLPFVRPEGFPLEQVNPGDFIFEATTGENAKELRKNMEAAGEIFDSRNYAHHMVPSTHRRGQDARDILERYGIDINDAINGVRLTKNQHYGQGLHSYRGIDEVTRRLRTARSRQDVEAILQKIKDDIENKTLLP